MLEGIFMQKSFSKLLKGYEAFRKKYVVSNRSIMRYLSRHGQEPNVMVVACCDSRVDPALILQCDPGDLFVVRNVANIVPPYEKDEKHHGTSAALEYAITVLQVEHLILLGHSQCGGIMTLMHNDNALPNDFITNWVSVVKTDDNCHGDTDTCAKLALQQSYQNCLSFPWLKNSVEHNNLQIHLWFFDIQTGQIYTFCEDEKIYKPLDKSPT